MPAHCSLSLVASKTTERKCRDANVMTRLFKSVFAFKGDGPGMTETNDMTEMSQ